MTVEDGNGYWLRLPYLELCAGLGHLLQKGARNAVQTIQGEASQIKAAKARFNTLICQLRGAVQA